MQEAESILRINPGTLPGRREIDPVRRCQHIKAMLLEVQLTHQNYFFRYSKGKLSGAQQWHNTIFSLYQTELPRLLEELCRHLHLEQIPEVGHSDHHPAQHVLDSIEKFPQLWVDALYACADPSQLSELIRQLSGCIAKISASVALFSQS